MSNVCLSKLTHQLVTDFIGLYLITKSDSSKSDLSPVFITLSIVEVEGGGGSFV